MDLTSDQISVINTQKALDDLKNNLEADLADATIQYLTSKSELTDLIVNRAALYYKRYVDTTIENLEADYYEAKDSYDQKVDLYNIKYIGRDPENLEKQKLEASFTNDQVLKNTVWAN